MQMLGTLLDQYMCYKTESPLTMSLQLFGEKALVHCVIFAKVHEYYDTV